jgi:hypothetical protein
MILNYRRNCGDWLEHPLKRRMEVYALPYPHQEIERSNL